MSTRRPGHVYRNSLTTYTLRWSTRSNPESPYHRLPRTNKTRVSGTNFKRNRRLKTTYIALSLRYGTKSLPHHGFLTDSYTHHWSSETFITDESRAEEVATRSVYASNSSVTLTSSPSNRPPYVNESSHMLKESNGRHRLV